ncbi:MAG: glycosyltransferase [Anaerolineae bacterium]|nr:glycosyltransferase [Anaerolineae bacterium]
MPPVRRPTVTLVHDWLNQSGGAERVLEHLVGMFPQAPVHTSIYWRDGMPAAYRTWDIRTTWMDRLPGVYRHHQLYLPFYALAFGRMDLADPRGVGADAGGVGADAGSVGADARSVGADAGGDIVISNKSGFCHAVKTGTLPHLCYCLAPTRYVWQFESYAARENLPGAVRVLLRPLVAALRRWDYHAAQSAALHFVAISTAIQQRILEFYGRSSEIIHPPVDVLRFAPDASHDDSYLIVSRLVPYKRIDLAVKAFTALNLPLLIAGEGRDRAALEALAGPSVRFLGRVDDAELVRLLARCKGLVLPGLEDFGLTPLEAQASGRPVIAFRGGGALDTVVEGQTGVFFDAATPESLMDALERFSVQSFDPQACRANAERFGPERFEAELMAAVGRVVGES